MAGKVFTAKTTSDYDGKRTVLGDVLQNGKVNESFFLASDNLPKWEYLKGAKKGNPVPPKMDSNTITKREV